MNDLRQAAQQALEALEMSGCSAFKNLACRCSQECRSYTAAKVLRAALAQEQAEPVQEPVAWRYQDARGNYRYRGYVQGFDKEYSRLKPVPLYTAPPQREPLTDEEIDRITDQQWGAANGQRVLYAAFRTYARAVERKLEEKNRGR